MPTLKPEAWLGIMIAASAVTWVALYHILKEGNTTHKALATALIIF